MRARLLLPRIGIIVSLLAVVGLLLVRASDPALASALCCLQGRDDLSVAKSKRRRFLPNCPLRFIVVPKATNSPLYAGYSCV